MLDSWLSDLITRSLCWRSSKLDQKQLMRKMSCSAAVALVLSDAIRICARLASSRVGAQSGVKADGTAGSSDGVGHHNGISFHALQGLARDFLKSLVHTDTFLSRSLIEGNSIVGIAPLASFALVNFALALSIDLVAEHHEGEGLWLFWCCVVNESLLPLGEVLEGLAIGYVIDEHAAVSASVEGVTQ